MRRIGFSTGALAYGDFRRGLAMTISADCDVIELSALRQAELFPMLDALDSLDLTRFSYISIHAPARLTPEWEGVVWDRLQGELWRGWPVVVHPDALFDMSIWREFGAMLCLENMDKRKPTGRTAKELDVIFRELPDASLCFDIGHARQCDSTMTEAYLILKEFGSRLRQVHVSEVNAFSRHDRLSFTAIEAFHDIAHLIPEEVPLILETPVDAANMSREIIKVRQALPLKPQARVA